MLSYFLMEMFTEVTYNIARYEKYVWPFQLRDIQNKSLDKNTNFLKHVFINFIFTKALQDTFHFSKAFILPFFLLLFAVPLGYFLFNCDIFIKLSIYQILQSLKKIIIWLKKLLFDIKSYHLVYTLALIWQGVFRTFWKNFNLQFS